MDFLYTFIFLIAIITISLPLAFKKLYYATNNNRWIIFSILCYFILFYSLIYFKVFSYLLKNFTISITTPILEYMYILAVLFFGIYYLRSN